MLEDIFINPTLNWVISVVNLIVSILILWRISKMGHFETPPAQ